MASPVELIKEKLGIAEVVGSYLKLEKAGSNLKAKCPFHNEKTPSFFVSPARGSYYCFGCGAKGDIFSFVQAFEGLDFVGALRSLASRAGVEVVSEDPRARDERQKLSSLLEAATLFFQKKLDSNKDAAAYLSKRGLSEETISSWRIGFAPDAWRECLEYCREKGFTPEEIEKAGLTKTEKGKTYDRFRSRIMFPIFDSAGRVVAFSGRILGKESEHIPKYLNSPETILFSKSRVLYGFDRAKNEIRRQDYAMLVEGQMDLLMCHQGGFKNAVASSGTAFTSEQLVSLKRLSKRILMVFDADKAGIQASLRSASLALSAGMEVKVAALPAGTDPAELILKDKDSFKKCLRSSSHIIDFYLDAIIKEKTDERGRARAIRDKLLPYVVALESSIEADHFIHTISERADISESAIRDDLQKVSVPAREALGEEKEKEKEKETHLNPRRNLVERLVTGLWLWQNKQKKALLDVATFKGEVERILGGVRSKELFSEAEKMADELIYQAESYYAGHESLEAVGREMLFALEEDTLREELAKAMRGLAEAERGGNAKKKKEMLTRCDELAKQLNTVRQTR